MKQQRYRDVSLCTEMQEEVCVCVCVEDLQQQRWKFSTTQEHVLFLIPAQCRGSCGHSRCSLTTGVQRSQSNRVVSPAQCLTRARADRWSPQGLQGPRRPPAGSWWRPWLPRRYWGCWSQARPWCRCSGASYHLQSKRKSDRYIRTVSLHHLYVDFHYNSMMQSVYSPYR